MQLSKAIIVCMSGYSGLVSEVSEYLNKKGVEVESYHRKDISRRHFHDVDMVISIGGDGTFLKATHHIFNDIPILGINPAPDRKEGFFTEALYTNYKSKINCILNDKFKIIKFNRLIAEINGKEVSEPALNEFYFGMHKSYRMAKYYLKFSNKKECQKSSGVLVGTAQSSYSWIGSAGGEKLDQLSDKIQFIVRELYNGKLMHSTITKGLLNVDEEISLIPLTKGFILTVDSIKEIGLSLNDIVVIKNSSKPLSYFVFDEEIEKK